MGAMMGDALSVFGIAISIALFIVGYRKTVGARNERVLAANRDLERVVLRRMVLES